MKKSVYAFVALIVILAVAAGGILAFNSPTKPQPLASISNPFKNVDYSGLPPDQVYAARDGTQLGYKFYEGKGDDVIVMIHGSSDDASGMHSMAKAFQANGASVYTPVLRGHAKYGRSGDIDYIGQLNDDLADLIAKIKPEHPSTSMTLLGFSSGGGFVFSVLGSTNEALFDRFVLISPALPYDAPTIRPGTGGWASVAIPRIIILTILNKFHITVFNGLPIVAFATSPESKFLTSKYSFRMAANFSAPQNYLERLGNSKKPITLLEGGRDELFFSDRFAPLLQPVRPDMKITIVPDIDHIGMSLSPVAITTIIEAFQGLKLRN